MKLSIVNISALVFACLIFSQAQAQNLIINPGFENGFADWEQIEPVQESDVSKTGDISAKLSSRGATISQWVPVRKNTNYTLSAFVKTAGRIGVELGSGIKKEQPAESGSSVWEKVTITFNSGSSESVLVYANYYIDLGRVDDFSLIDSQLGAVSSVQTPVETNCLPMDLPIASAADDGLNDGNMPENTIDGNLNNRWASKGSGRYLTLDLGQTVELTNLEIKWHKGAERVYVFSVETSVDGKSWQNSLMKTSSQSLDGFETHNIENLFNPEARFVKIIGEGNSFNEWTAITETKVVGCI